MWVGLHVEDTYTLWDTSLRANHSLEVQVGVVFATIQVTIVVTHKGNNIYNLANLQGLCKRNLRFVSQLCASFQCMFFYARPLHETMSFVQVFLKILNVVTNFDVFVWKRILCYFLSKIITSVIKKSHFHYGYAQLAMHYAIWSN